MMNIFVTKVHDKPAAYINGHKPPPMVACTYIAHTQHRGTSQGRALITTTLNALVSSFAKACRDMTTFSNSVVTSLTSLATLIQPPRATPATRAHAGHIARALGWDLVEGADGQHREEQHGDGQHREQPMTAQQGYILDHKAFDAIMDRMTHVMRRLEMNEVCGC